MAARRKTRTRKWERPNGYRMELYRHQDGLCCYCDEPMHISYEPHPKRATLEHLKRKCEGGTNYIGNLAVACQDCNVKRGSKSWLEWKTIKTDGELV